ncbi:hypothetical protein J7J90_04450 [Candidatus Micrarchaeota archaeon]|nr:hypothetical protein [Candidatus Micrarchaeota archaeon]
MKEITVITPNEVGVLAKVCESLGNTGINLYGISAHGVGDKGIIKIVTSDPTSTENFLKKQGFQTKTNDVIVVKIMDRPGELGKITKRVARAGANLEAVYLLNHSNGYVELALVPEKPETKDTIIEAIGKENII